MLVNHFGFYTNRFVGSTKFFKTVVKSYNFRFKFVMFRSENFYIQINELQIRFGSSVIVPAIIL